MLSVLLLDDNVDFRNVLKELLEALGYQVKALDNGLSGLEYLQTQDVLPDAIICDIRMPDMDGLTFLTRVRENPEWNHLCLIASSGAKDDREPALEHGADAYISKPFNIGQLREHLEKCLRRSSGNDQNPNHS
ncbi:MAG: response regulator [Anaerolineae bacterium]|nr:response regulator [Anaerolineae bacterium]MCA9910850.1 response regulator [Anaerolineae bacterium]